MEVGKRPPIARPQNNLGLEGQYDFGSGAREQILAGEPTATRTKSSIIWPKNSLGLEGHNDFNYDNINKRPVNNGQTVSRSTIRRPSNNLRLEGDLQFDLQDNINRTPLDQSRRSSKLTSMRPKDNLSLAGDMDLSRIDSINQQVQDVSKNSRGAKFVPKNTLGLHGDLDLTRPDNINQQWHPVEKRNLGNFPKDNLGPEGKLDLSRPDNINQQSQEKRSSKKPEKPEKPKENLGNYGHLDMSQPDSINRQVIQRSNRVSKSKPNDTLGPHGDKDFDRGDNINNKKLETITRKSSKALPAKDNLSLDGSHSMTRNSSSEYKSGSKPSRPAKPGQDNLKLEGDGEYFSSRDEYGKNGSGQRPNKVKPADYLTIDRSKSMSFKNKDTFAAYDGKTKPLRGKGTPTTLKSDGERVFHRVHQETFQTMSATSMASNRARPISAPTDNIRLGTGKLANSSTREDFQWHPSRAGSRTRPDPKRSQSVATLRTHSGKMGQDGSVSKGDFIQTTTNTIAERTPKPSDNLKVCHATNLQ